MAQQQRHLFPLLKSTQVLEALRDIEVDVTLEQLRSPTPEVVTMVYRVFVEVVFGITEADLERPTLLAQQQMTFPDMHEESVKAVTFLKLLVRLMRSVGVPDFSPVELEQPEFKQFMRGISALINFCKFREARLDEFERLLQDSADVHVEQGTIDREKQDAEGALAAFKAQLAAEQPEVDQLKDDTAALSAEIQGLNTQQAQLHEQIAELKKQRVELTEACGETRFQLKAVEQENAKLSLQIVHEPEKVQQLIADMKASLKSETEELAAAEAAAMEAQARLETLARVEKEMVKAAKLQAALQQDMAKASAAKKEVKDTKERLAAKNAHIDDLDEQEAAVRRQIQAVADKAARFREKAAAKDAEADAAIEAARAHRAQVDQQAEASRAEIARNVQAAKDVAAESAAAQGAFDATSQSLMSQYEALDTTLRSFHAKLLRGLAGDENAPQAGVATTTASAQQAAATGGV